VYLLANEATPTPDININSLGQLMDYSLLNTRLYVVKLYTQRRFIETSRFLDASSPGLRVYIYCVQL
jgi:hypothetical protein